MDADDFRRLFRTRARLLISAASAGEHAAEFIRRGHPETAVIYAERAAAHAHEAVLIGRQLAERRRLCQIPCCGKTVVETAETCEYCGKPENTPNFAYHVCASKQ